MGRTETASTRRKFLAQAAVLTPVLSAAEPASASAQQAAGPALPRVLSVVCVCAHPADAELACGGTLARYADSGHRVAILHLTRGEGGLPGRSQDEAAKIRTAEAEASCKLLGVKPLYAGQIDGATEINRERTQSLATMLAAEEPDVVITHWPLDTHSDHHVAALLTFRAFVSARKRFALYFFEILSGTQTLGFVPAAYVDITQVQKKKQESCVLHPSHNVERYYREYHEPMQKFRGREMGVEAAEAFATLGRNDRNAPLPGL